MLAQRRRRQACQASDLAGGRGPDGAGPGGQHPAGGESPIFTDPGGRVRPLYHCAIQAAQLLARLAGRLPLELGALPSQ